MWARHILKPWTDSQLHSYHSQEVQKTMRAFRIGRVQAPWINLTPPIQKGMHKDVEAIIDTKDTKLRPDQQEKPRAPSMTRVNSYCKSMEKEKIEDPSQSDYADMAVREEIERDLAAYPSLDPTTQHAISEKYRLLAKRVEDEGFYQCDYWAYGRESLRYLLLFSCFMVALKAKWYITSACFLGLFWHQIMFTAHDAGHLAITHNFAIDTVIACFIADFCCGLSIGWWKSSHNVHHLVTNLPVCLLSSVFSGDKPVLTFRRSTTQTFRMSQFLRRHLRSSSRFILHTTTLTSTGTLQQTWPSPCKLGLTTPLWALLDSTFTCCRGSTCFRLDRPALAMPGGLGPSSSSSWPATGSFSATACCG